MSWWTRLNNMLHSGRVDRELDEELRFHLEARTQELIDAGLTPEAAAAQAARRFGSPLRWREQSRDVKLLPWIDSVGRDLRLGARMLRRNSGVTVAAVISLSLALGACVAAFSLVDALILRPLPVRQPSQLVYLSSPTYNPERPESDTFNDPLFVRLRKAGRGYVDLFAMSTQVMRPVVFADGSGEKEQVRTQYVSGDAFARLGVGPAAGRVIAESDDGAPGASAVAVVSHAFWMRRFGGDPTIVGRSFAMDERRLQIVGVAGPRFAGIEPGRPTDVWLPYAMYNPRAFGNFSFSWFRIVGRLRDGASREQAQALLHATFANVRRERVPSLGSNPPPDRLARFLTTPLHVRPAGNGPSPLRTQFERPLWILSAIAALVLLIAGSNVANLFLAKTAAREREMALRLSIGAGRGRLIQQMLIESGIVAGTACAIGLLFATAAAPAVVAMLAPPSDPVHLDLQLDWRALIFAGGLTVLITAVFGLVPALRASDVAPIAALKDGARAGSRAGLMRPFIAGQVAFGLMVLFVGGLLVLSFTRLSGVDPGFATSNVLLVSLDPVRRLAPPEQRAALLQILDRLQQVPGVDAVSAAEFSPLGRAWTHHIRIPGTAHDTLEATMQPVTPGYFETMGIAVLTGRPFVAADLNEQNAAPVVVNQTFVTRYYGGEPAVGRILEARFADTDLVHPIVGVVADARYDLRRPAAPVVYIPLTHRNAGTIHARVTGDPAGLGARLRDDAQAASPLFRVATIRSQSALVDQTLIRERLLALLSSFFAGVGLILAGVGLYGMLSYSVVQRRREMGIRVALGARQINVIRTTLADIGFSVLAGGIVGVAGGLYLSRFVETLLFEVTALDFWSIALPIGTLIIVAALAAALPVLRAARVDPSIALKCE